MKKSLLILALIILAPVLLLTLTVHAASDWKQIGETPSGATVSVSSIRVRKGNQRAAWVRVQYKEPRRLPEGGPFIEMRARVRYACNTGTSTPTAIWLYSLDRSGKMVVTKKAAHDDQFGKESEGGFGPMVQQYVCRQK